MKITQLEIATYLHRTVDTIKYMKKHNPQIFEIVKIGCLVKKYNLDIYSKKE